jgi:cell division protein FtsI (penicillin-binding protein 3)
MTIASERGPILDRHGKMLAVSVPAGSVFVRPPFVQNRADTARDLARELNLPLKEVQEKLEQKKPFVWLARQIPRVDAERVVGLNIRGVGSIIEPRRYYPYNEAASTIIGKVGVDGHGLSGLELVYERELRGEEITNRVMRDALGNSIHLAISKTDQFAVPRGDTVQLTIDAALQVIMDEELDAGREKANAKGAVAVLLDSNTGEILAMSQAPGINFNTDTIRSKQQLANPIIEQVFEPGSILKPIVAAAALELGVVRAESQIDCEKGRYLVGRHAIKDVHPVGIASVHDVVVQSSNIGMTKIGFIMGADRLYHSLRSFGFGSAIPLRLPGETAGIFRNVSGWAKVDTATHSFGQGIAVSPLQIVRAISAIANGGTLPTVRLVRNLDSGEEPARVISPEVAEQVREMMYGAVEDEHGTGKLAVIPGVRIGGKTGTAEVARVDGRGYQEGAYIASFVGFVEGAPVGLPQNLTLLVSIREPNTTSIYGGTLAAPVFQRIMRRSLQHLLAQQELGNGSLPNGQVDRYRPEASAGFQPVAFRP